MSAITTLKLQDIYHAPRKYVSFIQLNFNKLLDKNNKNAYLSSHAGNSKAVHRKLQDVLILLSIYMTYTFLKPIMNETMRR